LEKLQDRLIRSSRVRRTVAAFLLACLVPAGGAGCRRKPEKPTPQPAPIAAAAVAPSIPAATAKPPAKTGRSAIRHVVIISEDGLRPDALTGVNPPVHEGILKRAAYSLKARTIRRASTLPSHAAMLSGFDIKEHGLFWNSWHPERGYIHVPTVFDAAKASGGDSAAFMGKRKLEHIARPVASGGSVDVVSRPGYFCKKVVEEATKYFVEKKPEIEFIHFSDPDDLGHSDGWMSNPQLEAVRQTDKCLATLLDAVAAAGLDRETLFIISADHGGHGHNHDGKIDEDRLIPWIAWGPGIRAGHRIEADISTVDTAATALWVLGLPAPPGMIGKPVREAFDPDPPVQN
jgi:predicted AlkP superfamily pyrophosphatase or phosphodiesterase